MNLDTRPKMEEYARSTFERLKNDVMGEEDVIFSINDSKENAAICYDNPLEIQMSRYFLESPVASKEKIDDILLHELAHAVVGPGEGHNAKWKEFAKSIGCTSEVCAGPFLKKRDYNYSLQCPDGCDVRKLKKPSKTKINICSKHKKVMKIINL